MVRDLISESLCMDSFGVNKLACLSAQGVNSGKSGAWKGFHAPRVHLGGHI